MEPTLIQTVTLVANVVTLALLTVLIVAHIRER